MAHMENTPVPLPYTSRLGQQIQTGQTLSLRGVFNPDAKRVEINLLQGGAEINPAQAALHLNFRFDEKKLVMNSYVNGAWGKEERESNPYKPGDKFDVRIRMLEDHVEIRCDGKKVHDFKHRLPLDQIEFFQIKGDANLNGVHWGGRFYQLPWETGFPNGGLKAGQKIHLYGIPKGDRWNLDLVASNGDILFHFNPRFKEKHIIRNAHKGGFWEKEEREGPFPFEKEKGFTLTIENEPYSIQIFVNDERVGAFSHRTQNPTTDYLGMRLDGEVEVTHIEFSQ